MTTLELNKIAIKQEKIDPEIVGNPNTFIPDSTNEKYPEDNQHLPNEVKKRIEPIKSSNEILAELFMVFNAAPPKVLLNTEKISKKLKKDRKKSKQKKRKHKKRRKEEHFKSENESYDSEDKKKRKHSSGKSVEKEHDYDDIKKTSTSDVTVIMAADSSSSNKQTFILKKEKDEPEIKSKKLYSKDENRSRLESRLHDCTQVEQLSDFSLSDEETYLRERSRYRQRGRGGEMDSFKYKRHQRCFYRTNSNSREHTERSHQHHNHSRHNSRSRSKNRTRSRSRSKDRSSLGINKKRLLEIARKNAITMFKNGSLPGCAEMSEEVKDKVLMKIRYGGKTVQDLTNFCKKLSKGESYDNMSVFSSDEQSDVDKEGNTKAFHHPFVLKTLEPIVMHIKNTTPTVPKTVEEKKAITMQFPVSSGQQHRLTEVWVPVPSKEAEELSKTSTVIKQNLTKPFGMPKNVFKKQLPLEEQQPAFKPVGTIENSSNILENKPTKVTVETSFVVPSIVPSPKIPTVTPQTPASCIFPTVTTNIDVSTIISQRLSAMRRLQENPMDCEAIKMLHSAQKEMASWASSKYLPGQFTGSTGANILSARELTKGCQAWARKDQLTSTVPVTGGMGMHLLKKMGWKPGEGLGREKTGSLQPLLLDVKLDKRGLVADEETSSGNRQQTDNVPKRKKHVGCDLGAVKLVNDNKHPVCLLNELASKRKWTPPMYELVLAEGPSHNKVFVFTVNVNGQIFNPGTGGNTKKEAKMLTAKYCLQQMGILS